MTLSYLKTLCVAAAAACAAFGATPAFPMNEGQCYGRSTSADGKIDQTIVGSLQDFNAIIRSSSLRQLIQANKFVSGNVTDASGESLKIGRLIFGNEAGEGYLVEMDTPYNQPPTKVCVSSHLANVKLFDARKPGVDPGTRIEQEDQTQAEAQCKKTALPCGRHNNSLEAFDRNGSRVMLQANALKIDGTVEKNVIFTVFGHMNEGGGALALSTQQGASILFNAFPNIRYTDHAIERLNASNPKPPQTSLIPR